MTKFACKKGCAPLMGGKEAWHSSLAQCPFESAYDPTVKGARTKDGKALVSDVAKVVVDKPGDTPTKRPDAPAPSGGLTASSKPAEIVPVKKIITPPQPTDFVVDAPHTRGVVDRCFGGAYQVVLWYDDWREWADHMPRDQFRLSELGLMSIENEPRNMYSRAVTTVCIWVGCKTQAQAHHAIDTFLFMGDFLGFGVLLIKHVIKVEKAWAKAHPKKKVGLLTEEQRRGAIPTTGREVATVPA